MVARALSVREGRPRAAPRRSPRELVARAFFVSCAGFVLLVTVAMLAFLAVAGTRGIAAAGLGQLLFGRTWKPEAQLYGGLPLITGTLVSAAGAVALGALPALLAASWVHELAPPRLRVVYRRIMELAAAVPSVVYGWLALVYLVPLVERVGRLLEGEQSGATGEGLASSSTLLAIMIAPTVNLLALDALAKVPGELRQASAALGASPLQTVFRVVVPGSFRGLLVAVFFGFARAAGETMAVQMVIGGARRLPDGLFAPTTTIASQIVMDMQNARPGTPESDVLFSMALVLLVLSVSVVLLTKAVGKRGKRRA